MRLKGKKFAILATDGFEQSELEKPLEALRQEGGEVDIISIKSGEIKGWSNGDWGRKIVVSKTLEEAKASDYQGLVLPGGVINPDKLRTHSTAIKFVKEFFSEGRQRPVAAICHGPQTLIDAGVVEGREMTSFKSIKTDLTNAGAYWTDEEVVVDNGLVTSREPADLPIFCRKMVEEFAEGIHQKQAS